jgi:hypothetical protein
VEAVAEIAKAKAAPPAAPKTKARKPPAEARAQGADAVILVWLDTSVEERAEFLRWAGLSYASDETKPSEENETLKTRIAELEARNAELEAEFAKRKKASELSKASQQRRRDREKAEAAVAETTETLEREEAA